MNSHIVRVCKWLQVLVPARLVVPHVVLESLHNLLAERLGMPVCLRMVSSGEIVFEAKYFAYGVKELRHELFFVVG